MKQCSTCRENKDSSCFYLRNGKLTSLCKECIKGKNKKRYEEKKEVILTKTANYYKVNKSKILEREKIKVLKLTEEQKQQRREYHKAYSRSNKEQIQKVRTEWIQKNQKERREYGREYIRTWNKNNKHAVVWSTMLTTCIRRLKTGKTDKTYKLLGYTADELKNHLDAKLQPGMTWENHGIFWNVHHNVPVSWFKQSTPPAVVSHLLNLYPLEKSINYSVGNKKLYYPVEETYINLIKEWLLPEYFIYF